MKSMKNNYDRLRSYVVYIVTCYSSMFDTANSVSVIGNTSAYVKKDIIALLSLELLVA